MDVNCLNCGELLFKKTPLDDKGNWAIDLETYIPLKQDEHDRFYRCQHCSAKNVVVDTATSTGLYAMKISHTKKD
jgi:DNA-directed RNA polymerase subunit RPC12/RpoP